MKKTFLRILSAVFYVLSSWIFSLTINFAIAGNHSGEKMLLLCLGCAGITFGSLLIGKTIGEKSAKRLMKVSFGLFFALYLLFILSLTLFDRLHGRNMASLLWQDAASFRRYLTVSCNFIPFRSIAWYFIGFFTGAVPTGAFITNFFGNICAFMPFAFFLPLFFSRCSSRKRFLLCIAVIVAVIELLQMAFHLGEGDIDDWILNVGGAWAAYEILRLSPVQTILRKITRQTV